MESRMKLYSLITPLSPSRSWLESGASKALILESVIGPSTLCALLADPFDVVGFARLDCSEFGECHEYDYNFYLFLERYLDFRPLTLVKLSVEYEDYVGGSRRFGLVLYKNHDFAEDYLDEFFVYKVLFLDDYGFSTVCKDVGASYLELPPDDVRLEASFLSNLEKTSADSYFLWKDFIDAEADSVFSFVESPADGGKDGNDAEDRDVYAVVETPSDGFFKNRSKTYENIFFNFSFMT